MRGQTGASVAAPPAGTWPGRIRTSTIDPDDLDTILRSHDIDPLALRRDDLLGAKKNTDGWELWLTDALTTTLGKAAGTDVSLSYAEVDARTVARIDVGPAAQPVFATPKGERKPAFLVRINSSTQELAGHDALDYQRKRWPA